MARYESPTLNLLQGIFASNVGGDVYGPGFNIIPSKGELSCVRELGKSDAKAATLRNTANRFYLERKFDDALLCYNESICYAEPGSDQLAMGYANRSAVNYEQGEYGFALYNIDLAKRNNYPEKFMPKLLARELRCKQQIEAGYSKGTIPCPRMDINVEVNPKIPFLAKGIKMDYDPELGRGLFAERDFNPGDIILNEKLELCGIDFNGTYRFCHQCGVSVFHGLIPCPNCPFFMYCSQECLDLNWKLYHRFECAVSTKLCSISHVCGILFSRLFFYGLSQFGDDLQAMMEYCDSGVTKLSDLLQLDYTNLNRLEVFKALHNCKPRNDIQFKGCAHIVSCYYNVFLLNPTVSAIIRTPAHELFFLRTLLKYTRVAVALRSTCGTFDDKTIQGILPIGSLINHSCDPNAITSFEAGTMKIILLRPIRQGEQIFTADGSTGMTGSANTADNRQQC